MCCGFSTAYLILECVNISGKERVFCGVFYLTLECMDTSVAKMAYLTLECVDTSVAKIGCVVVCLVQHLSSAHTPLSAGYSAASCPGLYSKSKL